MLRKAFLVTQYLFTVWVDKMILIFSGNVNWDFASLFEHVMWFLWDKHSTFLSKYVELTMLGNLDEGPFSIVFLFSFFISVSSTLLTSFSSYLKVWDFALKHLYGNEKNVTPFCAKSSALEGPWPSKMNWRHGAKK